jgi:small GTP-binding protein
MGNNQSNSYKKCVFCGDSGVGKTCLRDRMISENEQSITKFNKSHIATETGNVESISFEYSNFFNGGNLNIGLWDSCGQERLMESNKYYYSGCDLYIHVIDAEVTNTLEKVKSNLKKWGESIFEVVGYKTNIPILVVFNKIDKADSSYKKKFSLLKLRSFMTYPFNIVDTQYVSAKSGENITNMTSVIVNELSGGSVNRYSCATNPHKRRRVEREEEETPFF